MALYVLLFGASTAILGGHEGWPFQSPLCTL